MAARSYSSRPKEARSRFRSQPSYTPCEILPGGTVFDEVEGDIHRIGKLISFDDFMSVPKGIGGRVGVIPWFEATVVGADGERQEMPMVRLCVSNHLYLSDFGGGFRKITSPYDGLIKELEEEVPSWKDEILDALRHPSTFILALEQCAVRPGVKEPIPLQFLLFPHVSAQRLDEAPFQPTDEVRAVMVRTLAQFHEIVDHRPTIASSGIRMYHLFRRHEVLGQTLEQLFSARVQEVEYQEEDLVDEKVEVVLKNGSTATFQELVRNNANFSRNEQQAWTMREKYALQQMARTIRNEANQRNMTSHRKGHSNIRNQTNRNTKSHRRGIVSLQPNREIMGNSSSAPGAPAQANAPATTAATATATAPPAASLNANTKKNNAKTVVQVPAENVTITKGGKRRRFHGGVASVHFDLVPRLQLSDAVMEQVTSAPQGHRGGRRTHRHKKHKKQSRRRR